jgi:putative Ca2+/H+ antiporter (TMEM165/GDT1 family)
MKAKGMGLIIIGVLGAIFICTFDIMVGKSVNDITGPKSILGLVVSIIFIIVGIHFLFKKAK